MIIIVGADTLSLTQTSAEGLLQSYRVTEFQGFRVSGFQKHWTLSEVERPGFRDTVS